MDNYCNLLVYVLRINLTVYVMQYVGKNIIVEYKIMINQKGEEITYAEVFRKQSKATYAEVLKKNAKLNVVMNVAEEKKN